VDKSEYNHVKEESHPDLLVEIYRQRKKDILTRLTKKEIIKLMPGFGILVTKLLKTLSRNMVPSITSPKS